MTKISACLTLYFRNHISYDLHLWYTCMHKRIISPTILFIFFFNFDFQDHQGVGVGGGVIKGQKMTQNDKKFCLSHSISQEPYIILQFSVHMYKMMISPSNFFIFQNFDFWGKRSKNDLKLPISLCFALYIRNCRSYHQDFDNDAHTCFSLFFYLNVTL